MANNITIRRNTPTAAILTNLYDIINKTIHNVDAYYTHEQIEALKRDPKNIFIKAERKTK